MKQNEIIEMAVAAGITPWTKHEHVGGNNFSASDEGLDGDLASLIQFAKLVEAKEREACAKTCEELKFSKAGPSHDALRQRLLCAEAIRARGEA